MAWLALLPLAIWAYLVLGHGRFWTTSVRLPPTPAPSSGWPSVAVVIPARDEAAVLGASLPTVLAQDYPGPLAVTLVDDASTDGTAALASSLAGSRPLSVVDATPRPDGWAGKLWALSEGVGAVGPGPTWLLFTDADIAHPPDSVRRLVARAEASGLDGVSLMARLRVTTGWERLLIPSFVYFFALLYPFRWVNRRPGRDPRSRVAGAAGGCVLVRRAALERAGGLGSIRGAVIDDVALGRLLKRSGAAIWLGLADEVVSVRPYVGLGDLWDMVARSAYDQLRYSVVLVAGAAASLAVTFVGPVATLVAGVVVGSWPVTLAGAVATALMVASYVPMVRYSGLRAWRAVTLPAAACLYAAMTVSSALRHHRGGNAWKGRRAERPGLC